MDVKSMFLNGNLQGEVYVEDPTGFIVVSKEHKVLKLRKALYGLHCRWNTPSTFGGLAKHNWWSGSMSMTLSSPAPTVMTSSHSRRR
jgi:hypothetical protein